MGTVALTLIKVESQRLADTEEVKTSEGLTTVYSSRTRTLMDAVYKAPSDELGRFSMTSGPRPCSARNLRGRYARQAVGFRTLQLVRSAARSIKVTKETFPFQFNGRPSSPYFKIVLLTKHDLTACHGNGLAGFVLLLDEIINSRHNVLRSASSAHGHFRFIHASDILNGLGAMNFTGFQILNEKSVLRVGPERTVKEIARADRIDLDAVLNQLQCEGLS